MKKLYKVTSTTLQVTDNSQLSVVLTPDNHLMIHQLDTPNTSGSHPTIFSSACYKNGLEVMDELLNALTWMKEEAKRAMEEPKV